MNIKEVEEKSGLTRANIRFYEKEGLVVPERKENGYRDYSEDNLEELKRIRLFRELEVPIEKIKELQNSPDALEQIMRQHILRLEQQMKHLQDAITICKDIQLTGVSYDHVNVEQYLKKFHQLEKEMQNIPKEANTSYQDTDVEKTIPHPMVRYVARSIDFLIYQLLLRFIWNVVFHQISGNSTIENLLFTLFSTVLMLLLEPLCISLFRTTLGKRIFGITLSNVTGERLSYKDALQRTSGVLLWGMGFNIPFFSLYRLYKSYGQCVENQSMEWDAPYIVDYQIPERTYVIPGLMVVFYLILSFFLLRSINLYEMTPPNKGDLTLEEYVENYNYYVRYYAIKSGNRVDMYDGVFLGDDGQIIPAGNNVIQLVEKPEFLYEYTYDGDYVTGVFFTVSTQFTGLMDGFTDDMTYPILALTAAQERYHAFSKDIVNLLQYVTAENIAFKDYQFSFGNVSVTCDVEYDASRIHLMQNGAYVIITDEECASYDVSFKIKKEPY